MNERELLDLLISRATEGLPERESKVLDDGLLEFTDVNADDLELATAAVHLAFQSSSVDDEPMPEHLKHRILEQAREHPPLPDSHHTGAAEHSVMTFRQPLPRKRDLLATQYLGWYAAAAALLLYLWAPWSPGPEPPALSPTLAEQRSLLIESAADVIRAAWAKSEIAEYTQVEGDVVWSTERQTGFMRLRGLPTNRISAEQYQLWIVDTSRDTRPIDGGVFDIPAGVDEIIVPIDAKLLVDNPTVFAITLEQPGGVVVSDGPLLVAASVGT